MVAPKFHSGIDLKNQRGINAADPSSATDLANKQYVDNLLAGMSNKKVVRVKTTGNVNLATALASGQSIDGKTLATGDRVFVGSQSTGADNGIYVAPSSGAASRASDFDAGAEIPGAFIIVNEGTVNGDTMWLETTDGPITVGTTSLAFSQVGVGGATYTADGQGIELTSTTFGLELDGTTLSKSASGLRIGSGAAGAGLTEATGVLAVGSGTGISVAADAISVDAAVVTKKYAADCVVTTNPQTFTHGLGTDDVSVTVWEGTERINPGITKGSGTVIIDFGGAPTAGQYRVVVHG